MGNDRTTADNANQMTAAVEHAAPVAAPPGPVPLPAGAGLIVGHAEDPAEADADRRADAALARLAGAGAEAHVHGPGCDHLRRSVSADGPPAVGYDGGAVPDDVGERIERLRGGGAPLPAATRSRMEEGFGASFSGVRVHVGEEPARLNRLVSAVAFTVGRDVFFGADRFDPGSPAGERVLAHELAHTLQPAAPVRRKPSDLASSPTATSVDLTTGDGEWLGLHQAVLAYGRLSDDDYDLRAGQLSVILASADAWEKIVRVPSTVVTEQERQSERTSALLTLRALLATEQRELATAGVRPDEAKQRMTAPRFKGDYLLEQVLNGAATLGSGDSGLHVTKLQQALADLDHLPGSEATGTFGGSTTAGLKKLQKSASLTETGVLDAATMARLNTTFSAHGNEARLAQAPGVAVRTDSGEYAVGSAPSELLDGTRTLSSADAAAAREVVQTKQAPRAGGALPTFQETVSGKGTYRARLLALIDRLVRDQHRRMAEGKAAKRSPTDLFDWTHLEAIAKRSKEAVDAVFGKYAVGPSLKNGAGLHDGWDTKVKALSAGTKAQDSAATWRVDKLLTGHAQVKALDREHGAIQDRLAEKAIVDDVRARIIAAHRDKLLEIHQAWPGFAQDGQINLQRFKATNEADNRTEMWKLFHMIMHEYLHTLEHSAHKAYQRRLKQQEGSMTLREGVVEYFSYTARESVTYDEELRTVVEGEFHDPGVVHPIPAYTGYAERTEAEKLAGIVGARNVMAAFFLGDVEKIGKAP